MSTSYTSKNTTVTTIYFSPLDILIPGSLHATSRISPWVFEIILKHSNFFENVSLMIGSLSAETMKLDITTSHLTKFVITVRVFMHVFFIFIFVIIFDCSSFLSVDDP